MSQQVKNTKLSFLHSASTAVDSVVGVFSPKAALKRQQFRAAYDVLDKSRTRKKRKKQFGTGDSLLDENTLAELRDIARDQSRNNPIAKGILKIERNGVIGSGVQIQARTGDEGLSKSLEAAWKAIMIESPCDVTGRFTFPKFLREAFLSYRRDGDFATLFTDHGLQAIEGEQIGTPSGTSDPKHFDIVNGVAFSKQTMKVIGYYIGKPNKWGYIQPSTQKKYLAKHVHLMFNAERLSQSRGEPALTASADAIDKISSYMDAELVAAKVNACFCMFISRKSEYDEMLPPLAKGTEPTGRDKDGYIHEQLAPGAILYGDPDESAQGIGQSRPGTMFDQFINRQLAIAGRAVCMPLMLITGDFSGASFMNARAAYDQAREMWKEEQDIIVKPYVSRTWAWFVAQLVIRGELDQKYVAEALKHEIQCRRWPYVDPYKEAMADKVQLENRTTTRKIICGRQGLDFDDVADQLNKETKILSADGKPIDNTKDSKNEK